MALSLGAAIGSLSQPPLPPLPQVPAFAGVAPTPTHYGDFSAPDPAAVANDPYYQFRSKEGDKAIQASAAARGTLLSGGTLKSLASYQQGLASEEAGKAFDRALASYNTNRSTADMNFGHEHTAYGDSLAGYDASLAGNRLGFDESTALYDRANANYGRLPGQQMADDYAAWVAQQRQPIGSTANVMSGSASTNARVINRPDYAARTPPPVLG